MDMLGKWRGSGANPSAFIRVIEGHLTAQRVIVSFAGHKCPLL